MSDSGGKVLLSSYSSGKALFDLFHNIKKVGNSSSQHNNNIRFIEMIKGCFVSDDVFEKWNPLIDSRYLLRHSMRAPSETRRKKESIDFLDDTGFLQMRHPANHFYTNLIEPYSTLYSIL